jgi:ferric-dicitrate binding protein FerR (iron transport regulator)
VARRLCRLSLEIPARRGREPFRGWVSRLVHRTTSRARESHSRDATRRRDEKTRAFDVARPASIESARARAPRTHPERPSKADRRARRAGSRAGGRGMCVCVLLPD